MAVGVSAGLLWAFWLPVGQIFMAVLQSIILRGNLPAAAVSTLITNPFTYAPWFYAAHELGNFILGPQVLVSTAWSTSTQALGFLGSVVNDVASMSIPWMLGMFIFGLFFSTLGFCLTPLVLRTLRRRRTP